ncbi:hypothetical protein OGATHE_004890, partial [Ogataea polymorpha]
PLIIYNTTNAPYFGSGYPTALGLFAGEAVIGIGVAYLIYRESNGFSWFFERRDNDFKRLSQTDESDTEKLVVEEEKYEHSSSKSLSI